MWLEKVLLSTAAAVSIVAITFCPLTAMSFASASSLRGGDINWCTEHYVIYTCDSCVDMAKCLTTNHGTNWRCQSSVGVCQACILGIQVDCGGDLQLYSTGDCSGNPWKFINSGCTLISLSVTANDGTTFSAMWGPS